MGDPFPKPALGKNAHPRSRRNADIPGPVGERVRAESDRLIKARMKRENAYHKLKRALAAYAKVANEQPLISAERKVAEMTQLEMLRRLEENAEKISPSVLGRWKDSAVNTVARSEQWDRPKGIDRQDALAALTDRMSKLKGKLRVEISVEEPTETIDVEVVRPEPERIEG